MKLPEIHTDNADFPLFVGMLRNDTSREGGNLSFLSLLL
jgi:hypothetical protein